MTPRVVFGGTFDPVHLGHLSAAWEASELLDAPVHLVPANVPPLRTPPQASAAARVAILRAALRGQNRLCLDTRELDRAGPSYTVDTLADLRRDEGVRPLVVLVGADAFAGLCRWHRWRELFDLAHIGILTRPGVTAAWPEALSALVQSKRTHDVAHLRAAPAGRVIELNVTPLAVSATRVRELLAARREPRYLLPSALFDEPALLAPYRA